jgi:fucokinase
MAGDTMLNLPTDVPSWEQLCEQYRRCRLQRLHDDDDEKEEQSCGGNTHSYADVIGVAVPAPIETAQNHGVYLLDERSIEGRDQATPDFGEAGLFPCSQVWQKPPIERLRDYHARRSYSGARYQGAWIDTGIVIFLPHVVQALLELSDPYFAPIKINPDQGPLVKTEPLPKLDLYTHILQAFRTTSASLGNTASDGRSAKERYCESLYSGDSKGRDLAPLVWDTLSGFALSVWCLPGDFLHLGTSRELARFLSVASTATSPVHRSRDAPDNRCDPEGINDSDHQTLLLDSDELLRRMGRSLRLVRRCNAHYATGVAWDDPESVVACHILLKNEAFPSAPLAVGSRTVLEHCWIEVPSDYRHSRVRIGSNCLVSGLRYIGAKYSLNVPDGMIVQMVSLPPPEPMHNEEASIGTVPLQVSREIALVVLGIDDPIKSRDTLFGRPFQAFLEWCQLSEHDIWDEGSHPASRTVWTARIHAVIDNRATTSTIFDWLTDFVAYNSEGRNECFAFKARHLESLAAWKASKRLSLAEIRDATGAAAAEFEYRRLLATRLDFERDEYFHRVARLMSTRVLEPLDWRWIVDDYTATNCVQPVLDMLRALDWVIQESLLGDTTGPKLDVCGRACRVAGAFLRDICDTSVRHSNDSCEQSHSTDFGFSSVTMNSLGPILPFFKTCASKRDKCVLESPLETFRESLRMMDAMAQLMTEQCVLGESPTTTVLCGSNSRQSTARPVINRWVVATAPARIDLAGGWTDTPPICFEYGSFVTGVAVLVDGLKPLSCSCRILSGSSGIRLRTESRDGRTGDLLSSPVDVRIMDCVDLEDFRKPTSDCALLKCALVLLGLLEPLNRKKGSLDDKPELQELVNEFCQVDYTVGIEIVASSSLPQGSGLGTSSILGGCVIASIHRCLGHDVAASDEWIDELVDSVLRLEQLLTTGGGFQDQVSLC